MLSWWPEAHKVSFSQELPATEWELPPLGGSMSPAGEGQLSAGTKDLALLYEGMSAQWCHSCPKSPLDSS